MWSDCFSVMEMFKNLIPVIDVQLCECTKNSLNYTPYKGEFYGMQIMSQLKCSKFGCGECCTTLRMY